MAFFGCSDSGYKLDIRFPTMRLRDRVTELRLRVLARCDAPEPIDEIRLVKGDPHPATLGKIDNGRYAIEATAYETRGNQLCEVARGCEVQTLEGGQTQTILVVLEELPVPLCIVVKQDGGIADSGFDTGIGLDAGHDAGTERDAGTELDAATDADEPELDAGECTPSTEVCNAVDDDCDDRVDEGLKDADRMNCGTCGHVCDVGLTCASAACVEPAVQIAPGHLHTCALRGDGRVLCWGGNPDGELATGNRSEQLVANVVPELEDVTQIGSGKYHVCAIRDPGEVVCWGDDGLTQLGDTPGGDQTQPVAIANVGTTESLGIGFFHSCVVVEGGDVVCWGWNGMGQCGTSFVNQASVQSTPMPVPDLHDVVEVDGGYSFTCARHTNRRVSCWGSNEKGQLGDGTLTNHIIPAVVKTPSTDPIENVIALAVGGEQACVVQEGATAGEGTVLCWGVNSQGSSGVGSFSAPILLPSSTGITDAVEVAAGNPFSCARRSNGVALCWGLNNAGQLGDGTTTSRASPTPVSMLTNATSLYVDNGDLHSCAIRSDMAVVCWGSNVYGQLGNGVKSTNPELTPVRTRGI